MAEMVVHYPDAMLNRAGKNREELEREMRFHFAARMYELGEFSLGQAGASIGLSRLEFMDELGRAKIPVINFDDAELEVELSEIRKANHRG